MLKSLAKALVPQTVREYAKGVRSLRPVHKRECNICGYKGFFYRFGHPGRADAKCPNCSSLERHRLLILAFDRGEIGCEIGEDDKVLHFAPEKGLVPIFRKRFANYVTADLFADADIELNLEQIDLLDNSQKMIIANHVLEHVDDYKAAKELHRILAPGGLLVCMVPIVEGWDTTFENPEFDTAELRTLHYGQADHVRHYGRDFRTRIASGGLTLASEITADAMDSLRYGLIPGEKVFVFRKDG